MSRRYGIIATDEGKFVCATMYRQGKGWRCLNVRQWNSDNQLRNALLLARPVSLGISCHWLRTPPAEKPDILVCGTEPSFVACTNRAGYELFTGALENNIVGVYPDDALLTTLPVHFASQAEDSFIALLFTDAAVRIGVTVNRTLIAAFSAVVSSAAELEGEIGRIERYLEKARPQSGFPSVRYTLDTSSFCSDEEIGARRIDCGTEVPGELRAMGCALCGLTSENDNTHGPTHNVPAFGDNFAAGGVRKVFTAIVYGVAALFAVAVIATGTLALYSRFADSRLLAAKNDYLRILEGNTEIRELAATADTLSRRLMRINRQLSMRTTWGPFLHQLGSTRPRGLFLERLGSESVIDSVSATRIALAGWCENETVATEYIKALQESKYLSDVTLASMNRISEQQTACRFKIICILSLSEK